MDADTKAKAQERVAQAREALEEAEKAYDIAGLALSDAIAELDAAQRAVDYPPKNPNI
jgi:hypothetical protein